MTTEEHKNLTEITKSVRDIPYEALNELANTLEWGTYRDGEYKFFPLNDLTSDHLENILITQRQIPYKYSRVILYILKNRYHLDIL